ncbi:hypothetical protein RhiirA4_486094 [Rhizophagus irregularis]|uniref:Uncharacterized protein n=1 Tax=Rhizophagus irregularis TaxID=588596 RepID=A0A2I1HQX9_9GLOM|nr:hypothetical protein RhiirA4_486094 [Rhizophagus irregularis]
MEWEKINTNALLEIREEKKIETWEDAKKWALEKNNFFRLGKKIIGLAEQNKIFLEYTTLNNDFKQRLKNENRYTDEKEIGEKRPTVESPSKLTWSPDWSIDDILEDSEKTKAWLEKKKEDEKKKANGGKRKGKKKKK